MVGRLQGIGPLGASVLVAHMGAHLGDMSMFTHARQAPAWLAVVPAQHATGGKVKLSDISKHGDPALRTLLITGARSAVQTAHLRSDPISQRLTRLRERAGWQEACVALVSKNPRMAWAMLTRATPFDLQHPPGRWSMSQSVPRRGRTNDCRRAAREPSRHLTREQPPETEQPTQHLGLEGPKSRAFELLTSVGAERPLSRPSPAGEVAGRPRS
jgi:hypothetical protein